MDIASDPTSAAWGLVPLLVLIAACVVLGNFGAIHVVTSGGTLGPSTL